MMHGPTSETKQQSNQVKMNCAPLLERELHPRLGASAGPHPAAGMVNGLRLDSPIAQRCQQFAGFQAAYGNQAVLRTLNGQNPPARATQASTQKKLGFVPGHGSSENGRSFKGMSASGAGTVKFKYTPEPADTSTKIVFIQVMRELVDDAPVKPSVLDPAFAFQDADTTADFFHVDYKGGESDPYYNGDDPQDFGTQGNATSAPKIDADTSDTPGYDDANLPLGKSKMKYEFRTIAFSAAGADKGKFYAYARWTFAKERGVAASITHQGTSTDTSLPKSKAAIRLFASNKGFVLPTP